MDSLILLTILISFFSTFIILPLWIKKARENNKVAKDMHKLSKEQVVDVGGIVVLIGTSAGILVYIALNTFYFQNPERLIEIFALLSVLFISAMVGFSDDLLGWKRGLSRKVRLLIMTGAAIPLMVINAGESTMLGINFGILYPLVLIPLGIVGATTTFNFLAGYNGLETGQGIIILSALAVVTYLTGSTWLTIICLCAVASLFAFYIFNMHPAKVFPGDVLTYFVGALIAIIAILGNLERITLLFFIPYILEVVFKLRGGLKKESFAKLNPDGSLDMPYKKIYGLEHLAIFVLKKIKPSKKVYEKDIVFLINGFQIFIILLSFLSLI